MKFRTAIDSGRIDQILGDGQKMLAKQDNGKGIHQIGNDQRQKAIGPLKFDHQNILRDQGNLKRQRHGEQDDAEDQFLTPKIEPSQRIADHRSEHDHPRSNSRRHQQAIEKRPAERDFLKYGDVAGQRDFRWNDPKATDLLLGPKRGREHPEKWVEEEDCPEYEDAVKDNFFHI